jgi:hypothetical protein
MDPYDMPEQLSILQSYDMSKIGFIQDLTRGIKKVLDSEKKPEQAKETVVVQQTATTPAAPLLQRAFMFLEDGEWNSANEYCEKVLDLEPQNAMAYFGKLMVDLKIKTQQNLATCAEPFDKNGNYLKAMRFADDTLKKSLGDALLTIRNRILEERYLTAHALIEKASTKKQLQEVINILQGVGEYKDSLSLISRCEETINALFAEEEYKAAIEKTENAITTQEFREGIRLLEELGDFNDAPALKIEYEKRWATRQEIAKKVWADYLAINDKFVAGANRARAFFAKSLRNIQAFFCIQAIDLIGQLACDELILYTPAAKGIIETFVGCNNPEVNIIRVIQHFIKKICAQMNGFFIDINPNCY